MTEDAKQEVPKKKKSRGCVIGLVIVGVAFVIALVSFLYLPGMLKDKMIAGFAELETKVKETNPPGYTDEDIHALFAGALTALDSGWVSEDVSKKAVQTMMGAYSDDSLTVEEAVEVLEALQMMNPNTANGALPNDSAKIDDEDNDMAPSDSTVGKSVGGGR